MLIYSDSLILISESFKWGDVCGIYTPEFGCQI